MLDSVCELLRVSDCVLVVCGLGRAYLFVSCDVAAEMQ